MVLGKVNGGNMISSLLLVLLIGQGFQNNNNSNNSNNSDNSINKTLIFNNGFLVKQDHSISINSNNNQSTNIILFPFLDFNQSEKSTININTILQFEGSVMPIPLDWPNTKIIDIPLTWENGKLIPCDKNKFQK
jgi:hypothetical protein